MKYFTYKKTVEGNSDRVLIVPIDQEQLPFASSSDIPNLVESRVLGLTLAGYLRFIKAAFPNDVSIEGRSETYPIAYWRKGKKLYTFLDLLNSKLTLAVQLAQELEWGQHD